MLNIGRMAPGSHDYYLGLVVDGVEDYYLREGEAPGRWLGRGIELVGVDGKVEAEHLRQVLAGNHPLTGEQLARHPARKVPGFDHTFRAPKSVSLLWGLGSREVADQVRQAHDAAVDAAVAYIEQAAARTRRGAGGTERVEVDGIIGAAFRHRTSRANDPLLHTHVLIANLAHTCDDGVWRTLESRRLFLHAKTAGYLYQAQLRYELTHRLGVAWGPIVNGHADLADIPRDLIDAFSQRRGEILDQLKERGESSARAAQAAALETRPAKTHVSEAELRRQWADRATALGYDRTQLDRLLHRHEPITPDLDELVQDLVDHEALTEHASTFTRRDLLRAIAERLDDGTPIPDIDRLADVVIREADDLVVALGPRRGQLAAVTSIRRGDGRVVTGDESEALMTTRGLLLTEHHAITTAVARRNDGVATIPDELTRTVLARRRTLTAEQTELVRRLTSDGDGVTVIVGRAGTGKTYALDAARQVWAAAGIRVQGVALAARAALELQDTAGIPSMTIHRFERAIADETAAALLPPGSVLIVDEAGMVGTRQLARLLEHARKQQAKVVLVGDPHQLPEIDAGGLFTALSHRLPAIELTDNRRQTQSWEVTALDQLRHGDVAAALDAYATHGRVVTGDSADELREQLVADWWDAYDRAGATSTVMVALRRGDVADLNARARDRLAAAGHLTGPAVTVEGLEFQSGDRIVCLRNDRSVGVLNGTLATVERVDAEAGGVWITPDCGPRRYLPPGYVAAGHVTHGYAITGHKAQGMTVDQTFVLGSAELYREWGYVAMSRGRESNRLYIHAAALDPDGILHGRPSAPDAAVQVTAALNRSRAQTPLADHAPHLTELGRQWRDLRLRIDDEALRRRDQLEAQRVELHHQRHYLTRTIEQLEQDRAEAARGLGRWRHRPDVAQHDRALAHHDARLEQLDQQLEAIDSELARLPTRRELEPTLARLRTVGDALREAAVSHAHLVRSNPPGYVLLTLGRCPDDLSGRDRWLTAVASIEEHRARWGITDTTHPLGQEVVADPARRTDRHAVTQAMLKAIPREKRQPEQSMVRTRGRSRGIGW